MHLFSLTEFHQTQYRSHQHWFKKETLIVNLKCKMLFNNLNVNMKKYEHSKILQVFMKAFKQNVKY